MNLHEFHFIRPFWLLALMPYLAVVAAMARNRLGQVNWSAVCDAALLPFLLQDKAVRHSRWPFTAGALAAFLAILALAGPSWQRLPSPVFRNDSALVIALDLSRSMDAEDIKPSRLIRARYKIADMLKQRKDGQTALLVFAGDAFTVAPLTTDNETIASQLEALTTDIMPSPGKNTATVLNKAVELFKQAGLNKGQIVLVSDGVDLNATLPAVRSLDGYSLSVLGVGTEEGAPIALPSGGFLKDDRGTIVIPKMHADEMARLSSAGNGIYRPLTTNDADIRALLAMAGRPEQRQQAAAGDPLVFELWEDGGPWLLLLALPLAALSFRKSLLCFAIILILPFPETGYALDWPDLWQTRDQQAAKAFEQGRYDEAAKLFENPDWKLAAQYKADQPVTGELKTPATATGYYNQGNVLAKSGRLEEAVAAYKKSLEIDPGNEDALYNKELVEKELEKQKKEREQQQQEDENRKSQDDSQQESGKDEEQKQDSKNAQSRDEESGGNDSSGKPETKPERQESSEQQNQAEKSDEKSAREKSQTAEQASAENRQNGEIGNPPPVSERQPGDEQQQANEQWLNRIPDDPAGLLRRKFKYQYGQRQERQ